MGIYMGPIWAKLRTYNHSCKNVFFFFFFFFLFFFFCFFFLKIIAGYFFSILDPYSSHMVLSIWVQHGIMLQIPHESLMGYPYRTHINTHLGPKWVLYFLLA